ncbi:MAG: PilZ domain-containing protein [Pseudomonadota bacterium]
MRTKVIFTITLTVAVGIILIMANREWFISSPNAFIYFLTGVFVIFIASAIGYARREDIRETVASKKPSTPPPEDRRRFARIQHKLSRRPSLTIGGIVYSVKDISEQGVRFANPEGLPFQKWVRGMLVFSDGTTMEIDGLVVRKIHGEIGLQLITTIPGDIIEREAQFRLENPL